jgi:predicted DNA-binding transcriptional regulator YafY
VKHTSRQLSETTTADMYRAMDRQHPVTLTYTKADGSETIRTVEIRDIRTTKAGALILRAADRQSGEMRTWRIDRIESYTTHRTAYVVELPASETPAAPVFTAPAALTAYEEARDEAAADRRYWTSRYDEAA